MSPKLFFLHIQKTAGRAVSSLLCEHYADGPLGFPEAESVGPLPPAALRDYEACPAPTQEWIHELRKRQLIAQGIHTDAQVWSVLRHEYRGLTVLREPRERVISLYNMWQLWTPEQMKSFNAVLQEAYTFARTHTLAQTLRSDHPIIRTMMHDNQTRQLASFTQDLSDASRDTDQAIQTLESFDVVGVTEMINSTARLIAHRFGWEPSAAVNEIGRGSRKIQLDTLDDETRAELDAATRLDQIVYRHALQRLDRDLAEMQAGTRPPRAPRLDENGELRIIMSDPIPGQGWNVREGPAESPLRWTGPDTRSTVWVHLKPGQSYTLRLTLAGFMAPDILDGLRIGVGSYTCPWTKRREGRDLFIETVIPDHRVEPDSPTRVELHVPRTLSHHDLDEAVRDTRQKGLNVRAIEFVPAEAHETVGS